MHPIYNQTKQNYQRWIMQEAQQEVQQALDNQSASIGHEIVMKQLFERMTELAKILAK